MSAADAKRRVAISQRVEFLKDRNERRDSLDRRWAPLLASCDLLPVMIPNEPDLTDDLLADFDPAGVILSGGGDLSAQGADAGDRDAVERKLVAWARARRRPVLGVCRGMQHLMTMFGVELSAVSGHVAQPHTVRFADGSERAVNSFHNWGLRSLPTDFEILASAADGSIEAARHRSEPIHAVMWHPERMHPFAREDQTLLKLLFGPQS